MTIINIPADRINQACNRAIESINDMIVFNQGMFDKDQQPRLGDGGIIKTYIELEDEYVAKRKLFYKIQAKVRDNRELGEDDFNILKRHL